MTVTIWGIATQPGQPAAHYNRWGELTDAHMYESFNAELPSDGIVVDCDHDGVRVGELVYAEIAPDARVHCVVVLDEGDRLLELDQPIYYSPTLDLRGGSGDRTYIAREARIIGLSLTFNTARVAATPLEMQRGDLRSHGDRYSMWPSSWRSNAPLLERAVEQLPRLHAEHRSATHIVDRRVTDEMREQMQYAAATAEFYRSNPSAIPRRNPGGLEHSQHRGRVISVR